MRKSIIGLVAMMVLKRISYRKLQHPGVAFAGRVPSDAAGALEAETVIMNGSGSQTGTLSRWGDYSAMTVDPVDDCTFWYINQYIPKTAPKNSITFHTRVASLKFPTCQ